MFKKPMTAVAILVAAVATYAPHVPAEDSLFIPSLTYRTGPFAGGGTPFADGYADYFNMLNERDGGINGVKIVVEECETAYNSQKGVECYEATKGKGALAYSPLSTGITLALIPKAPVDQIPVFSMGYGLSAAAIGEKFPWTFNYPTTYWNQLSSILKYIDSNGGIEGQEDRLHLPRCRLWQGADSAARIPVRDPWASISRPFPSASRKCRTSRHSGSTCARNVPTGWSCGAGVR